MTPRILRSPAAPLDADTEAILLRGIAVETHHSLDPWQALVGDHTMRVVGGRWAAQQVGILTPRQNGRTFLAEMRELAGLFALNEWILHITPSRELAQHSLRRMMRYIESSPDLDRQIQRVTRSRGGEEIHTRYGTRIRYGLARPMNADLVVFDDAQDIRPELVPRAMVSLAGSKRPQVWYLGGAVRKAPERSNQIGDPNARLRTFARQRRRALSGGVPDQCWIEYSAPDDRDKDGTLLVDTSDREVWKAANPAAQGGDRLAMQYLEMQWQALTPEAFETEVLAIGDWPEPSEAHDD